MSNANPPDSSARSSRALGWCGLIALVIYAVFLAWNFSAVAGGADSSGYLNSARLLAAGQLTAELRTPPEFGPQTALRRDQFQPQGFAPFDGNPRLSPTYAVGFPLHLAVAGKLLGWSQAATAVGVVAAVAALLLLYATARELDVPPGLAASGAVMLGAYPVFVFTSIQPLSDTLATTWCLAAFLAAWRARGHPAWAVACGLALAAAVLVRATNLLLLPALVVIVGLDLRRLGLAVIGGLPGALGLGYYNHALYGGALRSGYINLAEAFRWSYGAPTLLHFLQWLAVMLPTVLLVLAVFVFRRGGWRDRRRLALAAWFLPFFILYTFYEFSQQVWWGLRFILPATPALILAGLLGIESLLARRDGFVSAVRIRTFAAAGLAAWSLGLGWFWTQKYHLLLIKTYEQAYADAAQAAVALLPKEALVLASLHSGALYYYTSFPVLRWELVSPSEFAAFRVLASASGRPFCAVLFDVEEREALQEKCPGEWTQLGAVRNISLWQLAPAPLATLE